MTKTKSAMVAAAVVAPCALLLFFALHKDASTVRFFNFLAPGLVSTRILATNVRTNYHDKALLLSSLYALKHRRSPLAQENARQLLGNAEFRVWFNSALYLGALKDQTSVPYLIKSLRHTTIFRPETLQFLQEITRTNYYEFEDWTNWWGSRPLPSGFDWNTNTSLGSSVNVTNLHKTTNEPIPEGPG